MLSEIPADIAEPYLEYAILLLYLLVLKPIEREPLCVQRLHSRALHMLCVALGYQEFLLGREVIHEEGEGVYTGQFTVFHLLSH